MSGLLTTMKTSMAILMSAAMFTAAAPVLGQPAPTTLNGITTQNASASDAFPGLKGFLNMPSADRSQINVYYVLRIKHADPAAVHITMTYQGRTTPLNLQMDGRITPLPTRDQLNGGATVSISGPQSANVAMKLHVFSTQSNGKTYDAGGLSTGIKQANAAMGKIAGALALMLPKLDRVYFIGGGNGIAQLANGQTVKLPRTVQAGQYPAGTPYFVPSQIGGAVRIELSSPASLAHYDNAPK